MKTQRFLIHIILFTLTIVCSAQAEKPSFRFTHYTIENGLISNSVRCVLQSKLGYIWIGTENGLSRFDGLNFKNYNDHAHQVVGNVPVYALTETPDGLLWLGTENGVYIYNPENDQIRAFQTQTEKGIRTTGSINAIVQDQEDNLWFASFGGGIFKYNRKTDNLTNYEMLDCNNEVYYLYMDSQNRIWASGRSSSHPGIYRLNRTTNRFDRFMLTNHYSKVLSNAFVISEDEHGTLWIGTKSDGMLKVDPYSGKIETFMKGTAIKHIHSIFNYSDSQLLVGSDDGLFLLDTRTDHSARYQPEETNRFSLSDKFVYPIMRDKEGGLWIGTYYGGLNYVSPRDGKFESYSHSLYANSVGGKIISCFCEDKNGHIWIGSDDGGLSCLMPGQHRFVNYMPGEKKNSLSYHNIHALCFDNDDLWIGTYSGGLNVLDTRTGRFRYYTTSKSPNSIDDNSIYSIFKDRQNHIWVGTMEGINLYDRVSDRFIRMKNTGQLVIDMAQDTKGDLWFATQGNGVFKLSVATGSWKNYTALDTTCHLPHNIVNCLSIDSEGTLWLGTAQGACKYQPTADRFERIELNIPSTYIQNIIENDNRLWMTTTNGLVRYTAGEPPMVFDRTDGLLSDLFLPSSGMMTSDGKIYVGNVMGFNTFYPHQIQTNAIVPPVVLTKLEIFNKTVPITTDGTLQVAPEFLKELYLSHDENFFSLHFAALSYSAPQKNKYAYKLEGFEKEWNYSDAQTKATYTNLPAGKYTFSVKASNNDGVWNTTGAHLRIIIYPPFYLSDIAIIIYVLLITGIIFWMIRIIIARSEKKHLLAIEELNRRKENEIHEAKIHFFTMITHEIRTPVSLIIGPLANMMTEHALSIPNEIKHYLNIIERNSQRLLFLINQLLDFRKVESGGLNFRFETCDIFQLIRTESARFLPWIAQHHVTFTIDCPDGECVAWVDRESIIKLLSNLIINAVKFTRTSVMLTCRCQPSEGTFTLSVADNGCGIKKEEIDKIFQPFYQADENKAGTGIGLNIVRHIVDAHGGTITVESEIDKGSNFQVVIPLNLSAEADESAITEAEVLTPMPTDILDTAEAGAQEQHHPTLLIVDDHEEMRQYLCHSLRGDYTLCIATDGEDALQQLAAHDITLVISDWMMPRMDGLSLCKALRSDPVRSHIPFILLTAKTDLDSKIGGMEGGADLYIEKPFSLQYLRSCIKSLIDLREMLSYKYSKMPLVPLRSIATNRFDEQFLLRMNELIETNITNPELSVEWLADRLCVSRSGLFAKLKGLTNNTPNELIQIVRLKKAAELLTEKQLKINEVCYMVGFSNPSYFAKCFQKQFGISPSLFVAQYTPKT